MRISIQLVTWNGARYIPHLFASLRRATLSDTTLHVLDNASTDDTHAILEKELSTCAIPHTFDTALTNEGFVGGHNRLFAQYGRDDELVLLLNQDMLVEPDCFARLVAFMENHPRVAACSPRLMRWDITRADGKTDVIDTLGLRVYRSGRVMDWMSGITWSDELAQTLPHGVASYPAGERYIEVFGVSGAMPCFRVAALRDLPGADGLIFDQHFFSYKEDVDLAWRLRIMGWKTYLVPDAVAYHDRTAAAPRTVTDRSAAEQWNNKSELVRNYSYRNHWLVVLKNTPWHAAVVWFELKKALYLLFRAPRVLGFCWESRKLFRRMIQERRLLMRARRVHPVEIRRWMT
ncbi:MAG: glycosyltransferase [Candidatus Magasanikbacteria bacterium]|nr:glycosyltransferase [Candidatus Magasanikbacteria bacterium]